MPYISMEKGLSAMWYLRDHLRVSRKRQTPKVNVVGLIELCRSLARIIASLWCHTLLRASLWKMDALLLGICKIFTPANQIHGNYWLLNQPTLKPARLYYSAKSTHLFQLGVPKTTNKTWHTTSSTFFLWTPSCTDLKMVQKISHYICSTFWETQSRHEKSV